jgi:hypothetical protein
MYNPKMIDYTNKVMLWRIRVTIVAMEMQQCLPLFIALGLDIAVNN